MFTVKTLRRLSPLSRRHLRSRLMQRCQELESSPNFAAYRRACGVLGRFVAIAG